MKQVFLALFAKDPFPVARYGYPARTSRGVPQFQDREFHTRIYGYINGQLRNDTLFGVLIYAIAEAMPDDVGRPSGCRQRCRRPDGSGLLIADVEGFSSGVRNRIIVPRRQAKLVR